MRCDLLFCLELPFLFLSVLTFNQVSFIVATVPFCCYSNAEVILIAYKNEKRLKLMLDLNSLPRFNPFYATLILDYWSESGKNGMHKLHTGDNSAAADEGRAMSLNTYRECYTILLFFLYVCLISFACFPPGCKCNFIRNQVWLTVNQTVGKLH